MVAFVALGFKDAVLSLGAGLEPSLLTLVAWHAEQTANRVFPSSSVCFPFSSLFSSF